MNDYLAREYITQMVDDAIQRIDSLSIDELEYEFKSFGLDITRKQMSSKDNLDIQNLSPVECGSISIEPWSEQEKLDLYNCLQQIKNKRKQNVNVRRI